MINFTKYWSFNIVKIIIGLLSVIIIYNIYTTIDYNIRRSILEEIKLESQKDSLSLKLISMMQDSIAKKNNKSPRKYVQNFEYNPDNKKPNGYFLIFNRVEKWYWEDIIVFNKERNKGFSFIYKIDKSNDKRTFDYVDYYLVYKMNNMWYFYTDTPTLGFHRKHNKDKSHTKEVLQNEMYEDFSKYINILEGNIDSKIVGEWFENESINSDELRALLGKKLRK